MEQTIEIAKRDFHGLCYVNLVDFDGLTNMVDDQRILDILNENETLEDSVTKLIEVANDNGGQDNISVIAVDPQLS
jgi:protein phosphatase